MQAELSPQPGQLVGGKYRLIRVLGHGAMGLVYEAEHVSTGKRVAIKWLHPHVMESRSAVERLVREAQASARVRHSNVVDIYDVERDGDTLFLVMEYLEGETLSAVLERATLPLDEVIALVVQAMRGVHEAHRQGVIHRDIKPDNIFLAYEPDRALPIAKVLDFGISKLETPNGMSLTQTGSALGTPLYMSYEQLAGMRDVDARSDVYAFGVILYEALTGTLPYSADNFAELAAKVITTEPPTVRQLRPDLPEELDHVVMQAIKKRREERTPNLTAMIEALTPFAAHIEYRTTPAAGYRSSVAPQARLGSLASASKQGVAQVSTSSLRLATPSQPPLPSMSLPSLPPAAASMSSAPALRLDEYTDWGAALDRSQRSRREMEDRVTALIAGTMPEYARKPRGSSRAMWMAVGALTTLVGGLALANRFRDDISGFAGGRVAASEQAAPSSAPAARAPTPTPPPDPVAAAPSAAKPIPAAPPEPEVTPVEPAAADAAEQPTVEAPAEAAPTAGESDGGAASPEPKTTEAKPTAQPAAVPAPPMRSRGRSNSASGRWSPSGELVLPPAASPPDAAAPPAAVEPPPNEASAAASPAPATPPPAPAPEPSDDPESGPSETRHRAGSPQEDEF